MYIESKKMLIAIIVLSVIILALGGFITYDKFLKKEEKTRTIINDVSIDLTQFFNIGTILEKMDKAFNNDASIYYGTIYEKNAFKLEKLNKNAAIYVAIDGNTDSSIKTQKISGKKVKSDFEKMFSKELVYTPSSVAAGQNYTITYDKETDTYVYNNSVVPEKRMEEIMIINTNTEIKESYIKVKRKMFYIVYDIDANGTYTSATIYKKANKSGNIGKVSLSRGSINEDEVIEKYGSKLNTFVYTFKEEKTDQYRLYSIEKAF